MSRNPLLVPGAGEALDRLKMEVAQDLGLDDDIRDKGYANMTTRDVGRIGGNMVKRLIGMAEDELSRRNTNSK